VDRLISVNLLFLKNIYWKSLKNDGGADRDRTDDLHNAIVALFQLSYGPMGKCTRESFAIRRDQIGCGLNWEVAVFSLGEGG
jgi:hypothetical protein